MYNWREIEEIEVRNSNVYKSDSLKCTVCALNCNNHKMKAKKRKCISSKCSSGCTVEYKETTCIATNVTIYAQRNMHTAPVSVDELSPGKPKGMQPIVKDIMKSVVSEHPFLKPTQLAMKARAKMTALNALDESRSTSQNTLKNYAAKLRKASTVSLEELLNPLEELMCDELDIENYPNDKPFLYRVNKDNDGLYINGLGGNDDPFRIYISAPKIVLTKLYEEMTRENGTGVLLHLDSTYKTNLLGYHLIPCGFSDRSSTFIPLFYVLASHQKEEVF